MVFVECGVEVVVVEFKIACVGGLSVEQGYGFLEVTVSVGDDHYVIVSGGRVAYAEVTGRSRCHHQTLLSEHHGGSGHRLSRVGVNYCARNAGALRQRRQRCRQQ